MEKDIITENSTLNKTLTSHNQIYKQKLKNKDAVEFVLINDGSEVMEIIPVDKPHQSEEMLNKRDKIIENLVEHTKNNDLCEEHIPEDIRSLVTKLRSVSKDLLKQYTSKYDIKGLFENELKTKLEDLTDSEINLVYKIFKIGGDVKVKEYNEFGLPADIDPEVLQYVTDKDFNPDTDQFVPPVFENLHCNRVHVDFKREELEEDYREVYDNLMNDEDIEEFRENTTNNKVEKKKLKDEKYDKLEIEEDDDFLPDDFVLIANGGQLPLELLDNADEIIHKTNFNKRTEDDQIKEKDEFYQNGFGEDCKDSKFEKTNVKKNNSNNKEQNKETYNPSYKYITAEEVAFLNKKYQEVEQEYESKDNEINALTNKPKISKQNKALLLDAMEEMEEKYVLPKFPNNPNKNKEDDNEENEEEEYDEEEEFEDYEEEIIDEDFDSKDLKNLEIQDGVDLMSKDNLQKLLEYYNPEFAKGKKAKEESKTKANNKEVKEKFYNNEQDIHFNNEFFKEEDKLKTKEKDKQCLTWDEINAITSNKEYLERTMLLLKDYIEAEEKKEEELNKKKNDEEKPSKKRLMKYKQFKENADNKDNKDNNDKENRETKIEEFYVIHDPKVYENIINKMTADIADVNLPKKIGVKSEKIRDKTMLINRTTINESVINKTMRKGDETVVVLNKKHNEFGNTNKQVDPNEDDDKKERKKKIKLENKERREKKKAIKEAYKNEKIKVQKVVSNANKTLRNGLSVKEC